MFVRVCVCVCTYAIVLYVQGMPIATRQSVNDKVWVICDGTVSVADYYGQCLSVCALTRASAHV